MRSLSTDAPLPALPCPYSAHLLRAASGLLEASVSVVDTRREEAAREDWSGNAGTCSPAEVFLQLQVI